jgi:hypothetical protein
MRSFFSILLAFSLLRDASPSDMAVDGHVIYVNQIHLIDLDRQLTTEELRSQAYKNNHNLLALNAIVYAALEREKALRPSDLAFFYGMAYIINSNFGSSAQQLVVSKYVHKCPLSWSESDMIDFAKQQDWEIDTYLLDVEFHRWRMTKQSNEN